MCELLGATYPAMFKCEEGDGPVSTFYGWGLGGLKGVKSLPERLCDRVS